MLQEKLQEFRDVLMASDPDALAALQPGLPRDVVRQRLSRLPFEISPDAVELYSWANGRFDRPLELLPGARFMSLDHALEEFEHLAPMRGELEDIFPQRYRDNLRFLTDFSDGGYAFGRLGSPSQGMIVHLCIHAEWRLAYTSLEKLIETAIECRRRGVFQKDGIPDFHLYYRIGRALNPGMENWE